MMEPVNNYFAFVGVTTGKSAINKIFPLWADVFNIDSKLVGIDIPLNAPSSYYDDFLIKFNQPIWSGALVTTHKSRIFTNAKDFGIKLTDRSLLLEEISVLYKNKLGLICGDATDSIAVIPILNRLFSDIRWQSGSRQIFILGGGGSGLSLLYALVSSKYSFDKITIVESNLERLHYLYRKVDEISNSCFYFKKINVINSDEVEHFLSNSESGCLIVNATGMGKDLPGTPINDPSIIPNNSIIWDFNYRGELQLFNECTKLAEEKNLLLEIGWKYFINGWANVLGVAFNKEITNEVLQKLEYIAAELS